MKKVISLILLPVFFVTIVLQDFALAKATDSPSQPESRIYSLAVLELEPSGRISVADAAKITDRMRQELQSTGMFEVMSKNQVMSGLANSNLLETGCSTVECAIEAGKLLGTKLVANGTINKIGPLYFIEVQLVHVKSGQVVQKVKEEVDGDFKKLEASVPALTKKLVGTTSTTASAARSENSGQSQQMTPVENSETTTSPADEAGMVEGSNKGKSGKTLLVAGLVAVGVGAGIFAATAMGKDDNGNGNGGGVDPRTLPPPPTFP